MPWRRTFFVWVWSRYLAGATWARPFSPFLIISIWYVESLVKSTERRPCLLQLHPSLVSCSVARLTSGQLNLWTSNYLLVAIPVSFLILPPLTSTGEWSLIHSFLASVVDSMRGHSEGLRIVRFWGVTLWLFPRLTEKNKWKRHLPFLSILVFLHHI